MDSISFTGFDGLHPSVSPRALPADAAQKHNNLLLSTREIRPLADDAAVGNNTDGANNPLTLYRYPPSSVTFRASVIDMSATQGPINNDPLERAYLTYNDGSSPPIVLDNQGGARQLGVPKPTTPPTTVVNVVSEFSTDQRVSGIKDVMAQAVAAIKANSTQTWVGATRPGSSTPGWLDRGNGSFTSAPTDREQARGYKTSSTGGANNGAIVDAFSSVPAANFGWVFDPSISGFWGSSVAGFPSWSLPAGTDFYCIGVPSYAMTYVMNTAAAKTALLAIDRPGGVAGTDKLLTSAQADAVLAKVNAAIDPAGDKLKPRIDALKAKHIEVELLLNGGAASAAAAQMTAFYAMSDVSSTIDTAISDWAREIFLKAKEVAIAADSTLYTNDAGPGVGSY